ncbi:hypothetical protein A0H81_14639 [Grifola frondosa]|uniref:Uncharacterized protein n=1 Tax=Grifola frondosa TaxID=5627 RepID=A0A1C7LL72_GRIFR|nr:hypothetical protein A0H81_14639 [Grifola frondosa]
MKNTKQETDATSRRRDDGTGTWDGGGQSGPNYIVAAPPPSASSCHPLPTPDVGSVSPSAKVKHSSPNSEFLLGQAECENVLWSIRTLENGGMP